MKSQIDDEVLLRLAGASSGTALRAHAEHGVSVLFRSMQYVSSRLLADCVTLNLLLNDKVTEYSADEIIRCIKRSNRAFYTTVESAFKPIADRFAAQAKEIVKDYDALTAKDLRTVNLIVYVISVYVENRCVINRSEIFSKAYSYEELQNIELPHYKSSI